MTAYDVAVFGGTPAGVAAAVVAAERSRTVALVSQYPTVGGAISNGLGAADIGGTSAVTGLSMRFFQKVRDYYSNPTTWNCPPARAEAIFRAMLSTAGVTVVESADLTSCTVVSDAITEMETTKGTFDADRYVDATYTGDLAAMAGAPFRLGYGDYFYYGDDYTARNMIEVADISGSEAEFVDHPFIGARASVEPFADVHADGMPTMTFRVPLTNAALNKVAVTPAANYSDFQAGFQAIATGYFAANLDTVTTPASGAIISGVMQLSPTQDGKYDWNQGTINLMNVPIPMDYFTGDRAAVRQLFADYQRNWLYFCQTDSTVPVKTRTAIAAFGLCADEFVDNDHWPYEPYVREGRRVVGHKTHQVANIYNPAMRVATESAAIGTYALDSKSSLTFISGGKLWRDQGLHLSTPWYEIDRRVMIPPNLSNLVVPVCFSSSPRAHGSPRMEPQYMALGEAAGLMTHHSLNYSTSIIESTASGLKYLLDQNGAKSKLSQLCPLIPSAYRGSAGFTTGCEVAPFNP